jgi:hypothetical protein
VIEGQRRKDGYDQAGQGLAALPNARPTGNAISFAIVKSKKLGVDAVE